VIEYTSKGSLLYAEADALVNTVNTVGVMGKGVALQFKQAFPDNYRAYRSACTRGEVELGKMFVFERGTLERPRFIINFPTKRHWRAKSRIADIESGLSDLRHVLLELGVDSVALPALGCGNGGLRWTDVRPLIEQYLSDLPLRAVVFEPIGAPAARAMRIGTVRPAMTPGRAALIGLLGRYLEPGFGASLLEVEKLLYLLQAAGEPLRLDFVRAHYGPYAESLNHVLQRLEGHYVEGYGDRSGRAEARLLPGALEEAEAFLDQHLDTRERFDRVLSLIAGYESPYGLELLSTVLCIASEDPAAAERPEAAAAAVQSWSERKGQLFTLDHVTRAWSRLRDEGWLGGSRKVAPA